MVIAHSPEEISSPDVFLSLKDLCVAPVYIKCEGLNICGSIKLRTATHILDHLENEGLVGPAGGQLVESSSGNLGVALSAICAARGYKFTCVTDPNSTLMSRRLIEAHGGEVIVVQKKDEKGSYLGTRLKFVKQLCRENPQLVWTNQYSSKQNWLAHYNGTAKDILSEFPNLDWLFVGAGTTGTLMGCLRYFKENSPRTKIVAVDAEGSVTFGHPAKTRHIPGLGTSVPPEICDQALVDRFSIVPEIETVNMCCRLARKGYCFGGSTGTVLAGIASWSDEISHEDKVVAISPDFGEKYVDSIYNPEWITDHFSQLAQPKQGSFRKKDAGLVSYCVES